MKTLSLKELLAKATPGPYVCHTSYVLNKHGEIIADCMALHSSNDVHNSVAALLAHAANHIGPLVEALEAVLSSATPHPEEHHSMYHAFKRGRAILAAAKNVEVP